MIRVCHGVRPSGSLSAAASQQDIRHLPFQLLEHLVPRVHVNHVHAALLPHLIERARLATLRAHGRAR